MKKVISLFTLLLFLSAAPTTANTNVSNAVQFSNTVRVPNAVLASFDNIVGTVIQFWFGNVSYDTSNITWQRINGLWVATGNVLVVGGEGTGIHISLASFKQNGEAVSFVYNLL